MNARDEHGTEFERWLDGRLEGPQAAAFAERLAADPELAREAHLARGIEASLRRRFAVPEARPELEVVHGANVVGTEQSLAPGRPLARRERSTWRLTGLLAGSAAALLFLMWTTGGPGGGPDSVPVSHLRADLAALEALASGPGQPGTERGTALGQDADIASVGPMQDTQAGIPLERVESPDLETLYSEATALAADRSLSVCGAGGELAGVIESSYGQRVNLRTEAEGRLQGPFASTQWPTGVILAGGSAEAPAVLVAERDSIHDCCLALQLPEDSHLKLFTWRVGDLVLTEITPLEEPRLLDSFTTVF